MNFRGPIKNGFFWKCSLFAHSTQHVLFLAMVASARKDLFKEAAIVSEQDAWGQGKFGSQRLSFDSRPTLSLTGIGSSPRRFAARLAASPAAPRRFAARRIIIPTTLI